MRKEIMDWREIGKVYRVSKARLERANALLKAAESPQTPATEDTNAEQCNALPEMAPFQGAEEASGVETPVALNCVSCSAVISRPCWYCIDCPGTVLITARVSPG